MGDGERAERGVWRERDGESETQIKGRRIEKRQRGGRCRDGETKTGEIVVGGTGKVACDVAFTKTSEM